MGRRYLEPHEVEITHLGPKGVGVGVASDGRPVHVRAGAPGSRVRIQPFGRKRGVWKGRKLSVVRPPPEGVEPPCPAFGLCGGCVFQELPLESQREAKNRMALSEVARGWGQELEVVLSGVRVHPLRGAPEAYGYRNKMELSFGNQVYLSEEQHQAGESHEGAFLGFHAPGRFDRIVDRDGCLIGPDPLSRVLSIVRTHALASGAPAPWDARHHQGFWRHLRVRVGERTGEVLVGLYCAPTDDPDDAARVGVLAEALLADSETDVVGVVWLENPSVADAAQGTPRQIWGRDYLFERLGEVTYRLSLDAFFQTNTQAAEILYDTIGEAVGEGGGTLLDLYCGIGSIGMHLGSRFDRILGIEENPVAVADARQNAADNGLEGEWVEGRVEALLERITDGDGVTLVVDPPRAGLHPKVARRLASASGDALVYVACRPASLGRDGAVLQAGGWSMTDIWVVDLFPQTGHIEVVARFVR